MKGFPDNLPGIDLQQALQRLGNAPLLRSLLVNFREENAETMKNLRDALTNGDNQLARRIVHTVKGVGGSLGTTGLCSAALCLEEAMKRGWEADFQQQGALEAFEKELQQVLASIGILHKVHKAKGPSVEAPGKPALDVLPVDIERIAPLEGELAALREAKGEAATEVGQKILVVDDVPANIHILNEILRKDYAVFFATSGRDGIGIAQRDVPDLILLDIMMSEMDGYEVCMRLKADPRTRQIPVIFITAMGNEEDEAKGLECGAIDYITKPISPPIVQARVKNHLELKRNRDMLEELTLELEEKNRELSRIAREDALTGLANRRHFNEVLEREVNRARRSDQVLSLILCDVDFFKNFNDHYGHLAGDRCLKAVGDLFLQTFKRAGDFPARYGGEEFTVILPETTSINAAHLAEKLREGLDNAIPHAYSDTAPYVTLSFGVVGARVTRERDAEWFINEADKALYDSKQSGRNRVTLVSFD